MRASWIKQRQAPYDLNQVLDFVIIRSFLNKLTEQMKNCCNDDDNDDDENDGGDDDDDMVVNRDDE